MAMAETKDGSKKFIPLDDEPLMPLSELMAIATITEADVKAASAAWEANPPDPKFDGILQANEATDENNN
jgi:hypothetical protein